jgi:hypothetical protein
MRFIKNPRPACDIDRARILCERGGGGYHERTFAGNRTLIVLTKDGDLGRKRPQGMYIPPFTCSVSPVI